MTHPENQLTVSLREVIRLNSQRNSHAVALLAPDHLPITYAQLSSQVDYVGQSLGTLGIQRSDRVAVVLPNGARMASAFLGIASYATCAPLNPSYRRDEFEFYLSDLHASAIVLPADTDVVAREVALRFGLTVIEIESSTTKVAGGFTLRGASTEVEEAYDWGCNEDIALVLHTSGTTSRPKQVPLSHRNLCSSARNIVQVLELSPGDRCLNVMPLFHIHGLVGVLLTSMFAGSSVVCSAGYDGNNFPDLMRDFKATWYSAVPTIHQSILALARENPSVATGGHLRLIRSSSSSLPPSVMKGLEETFRVPVIESYGMTEAAHQMASNPLPPGKRNPGSVGLAAGPEMAIMNDQGNLLPVGEYGEIVIRGDNVTAGYVNNPKANEAAFTDGWFRTGDLGRVDKQGYFYLTGRKKEMINRGGENISPREIDEVLLEHATVAQAVAFAVPHASLGEDVAAAVVLHPGTSTTESELREFAFRRLADFKVPSRILVVDAIPKGPTGKLQRIGLHGQFAPLLHAAYAAPMGDTETKLASFWSELLDRPQVGRNDNYFLCGGDSLLASRLAARLRSEFSIELSLPALFQQPTLAAQAMLVDEKRRESQQSRMKKMDALLEEIEELSEEEAARLVAEEQKNDWRKES